jgi:hypothetical protein
MNIHDVVEPRDIFFQQHWDIGKNIIFVEKTHSLALLHGIFHIVPFISPRS